MAVKRSVKAAGKKTATKKAVTKKTVSKKTATKKTAARKAAGGTKKAARAAASKADRARVSKQGHEVAYVAKKFGVDEKAVTRAIAKVGNGREAVYAELKKSKARSAAADKALVSQQAHEVAHLAKKFGVTGEAVLTAIKTTGRSRKKVEAALASK